MQIVPTTRRRILSEIQISKIACVDKPACEGALVTIIKRKRGKPAAKDQVVDDVDTEVEDIDIGKSLLAHVLGTAAGAAVSHFMQRNAPDDDENDDDLEKRAAEHPFMQEARALAHAKKIPLYHAMSLHRRAKPQSYRHFQQQQGVHSTSRMMKSSDQPRDPHGRWTSGGGAPTLEHLRPHYEDIKREQGGISGAYISDLSARSGIPVEHVKDLLLREARAGNVSLHGTSIAEAGLTAEQKAGAISIPGHERFYRAYLKRAPVDVAARFEGIAKSIKKERGCSGTEALQYTADLYPELFARYRAGK
jgi:hypothetical protein